MSEGRREKTAKNLIYAWMNQMIMLIMNIVVRMVFVRVLSKEYLGLGGLFGNIISLLSLAELGVGTAITYSLYAPLAYNEEDKIVALMDFYKKVYITIGCVILVVGTLLTPFLSFFIKDMPDVPDIQLIYILFVINAAISYFFSYKSALISADQKDYIIKKIKLCVFLIMYLVQIAVLYTTKNYQLYLGIQIGATLAQNIVCSYIANRMYPYLRRKEKTKVSQESLKEIVKNTKALMFHKLGEVIVFSTDNLIISKFVGLVEVGLYSNYTLIQQALTGILSQIFTAMTASVGNLGATESTEKKYEVFRKVFFLDAWIYGFCSIAFLCLAQDFIGLFFGQSFVMPVEIVFLIVLNFYLVGMRKTTLTFRDAFGLFWQNRYMPICEATINLILSLILAKDFGVAGVLAGTVVSSLILPCWIEPYIVFRYGMQMKVSAYWKHFIEYSLVTLIAVILTWNVCSLVTFEFGLLRLVIKGLLCLVIPNMLYIICHHKKTEYKYYWDFAGKVVKKMAVKKWLHELLDWLFAGIIIVALCVTYISKVYYDKIIGYAPMITFVALGILFLNHVNWIEQIKKKDKELILLIASLCLGVLNLKLTNSGMGAIFNLADFLLILYLADKVKLNRWVHACIGTICLGIVISWFGKGDNGFNTNLASMILFALSVYGVTAITAFLKKYNKESWGKWGSLLFILGIVLPMVVELRARGIIVAVVVFVIINCLIPTIIWEKEWPYKCCVIVLLAGSILFPVGYVWLWNSEKIENLVILGKGLFSGRNIVWGQFLEAFWKEPITGIGSDFVTKIPGLMLPEVHNGLLHIIVVHGSLLGLITICFLGKRLLEIGRIAIKRKIVRQCVAAIVALAVASVFENYFVLSFYNIMVLLLFSIGMQMED